MTQLIGLIPSFREGPLVEAAARSLRKACDTVYIYEGPVGDPPLTGEPTDLGWTRREQWCVVKHGEWESDGAKRTAMVQQTRMRQEAWILMLDADEVLMFGEYVRDLVWAAEQHYADEDRGGLPLKIVEMDGSVGKHWGRLMRAAVVEQFLSPSQLVVKGSEIIKPLPLEPLWRPGEPMTHELRPVLHGEPHIFHRSFLRPPGRADHRLHKVEGQEFDQLARQAGVVL